MGFLVWCGEFAFFQSAPACGRRTVVRGKTLSFSDFPGCACCASVSTVVERLLTFKKNSCAGDFSPAVERFIIFEKILVLGIFWRPLALKRNVDKTSFTGSQKFQGNILIK